MSSKKYFVYYNDTDGTITEGTLRLGQEGFYTFNSNGTSNTPFNRRYVFDVSTFIPMCQSYDPFKDEQDTIAEIWESAVQNLFQFAPDGVFVGNFTLIGSSTSTANGVTSLFPFNDFNHSTNNPCDELQTNSSPPTMDVMFGLSYADGLNNDGNTTHVDANGNQIGLTTEDAKVRLILSSTQNLSSGWYAISFADTMTDAITPATRINADLSIFNIRPRIGLPDGSSNTDVTNNGLIVTSGLSDFDFPTNRIIWDVELRKDAAGAPFEPNYYETIPEHSANTPRKLGYIVWRTSDSGSSWQIADNGTVDVTVGTGGTVSVDSNGKAILQFSYRPTVKGSYKVQFFEHEDTYRFSRHSNNAQRYDKWHNYYQDIIDHHNGPNGPLTPSTVESASGLNGNTLLHETSSALAPSFTVSYSQNQCNLTASFTDITSHIHGVRGRLRYNDGSNNIFSTTRTGSSIQNAASQIVFPILGNPESSSVFNSADRCQDSYFLELEVEDASGTWSTFGLNTPWFQSPSGTMLTYDYALCNVPQARWSTGSEAPCQIRVGATNNIPSCAQIRAELFKDGSAFAITDSSTDITGANTSHYFDISSASSANTSTWTVKFSKIADNGAVTQIQGPLSSPSGHFSVSGTPNCQSSSMSVSASGCSLVAALTTTGYSSTSDLAIRVKKEMHTGGNFVSVTGGNLQPSDITPSSLNGSTTIDLGSGGLNLGNGKYQLELRTSGSNSTVLVAPTPSSGVTVSGCPSITTSTTALSNCRIQINVTNFTGLGSEIRAVLFYDTNQNGVINISEAGVTGATNASGQALDFGANPSGNTLQFTSSTQSHIVNLSGVTNAGGANAHYVVEFQALNNSAWTPLTSAPFNFTTQDGTDTVVVNNCTVCSDNSSPHYITVDSNGNIISTSSTSKGMISCSNSANTVPFAAGGYCKTSGSQMTVIGSTATAGFGSPSTGCIASVSEGTAITIRLQGSSLSSGTLRAFRGTNFDTLLSAGTYMVCSSTLPASDFDGCTDPERFIKIEGSNGDWDGKLYDSNGSAVSLSWLPDATKWYDESQWLGWTGSATATGWTGASPSQAGAASLCANQYVPVNAGAVNAVYVSGNISARKDSDKLRVYVGAGRTTPLAAGWYRYCGTPTALKANGVPEFREPFKCYGDPFVWYSTKHETAFSLTGDKRLFDDGEPWFSDASVKDLTPRNCDLGFDKAAADQNNSDIYYKTQTVDCTNWGGGGSVSKNYLEIASNSVVPLSNHPYSFFPSQGVTRVVKDPEGFKTSSVTICTVVDFEATNDQVIWKFGNLKVRRSNGDIVPTGNIDSMKKELELGGTITASYIELKWGPTNGLQLITRRETGSLDATSNLAWTVNNTVTTTAAPTVGTGMKIIVVTASPEGHLIRVDGEKKASNNTASEYLGDGTGIHNLSVDIFAKNIEMKFFELMKYTDELNTDEIRELEGYQSEKWCHLLTDSNHPYRDSGPECGECDSDCCESEVTMSHAISGSSNETLTMNFSYESTENVFGYQFKVEGWQALNITRGVYTEGDLMPDGNPVPGEGGGGNGISVDHTYRLNFSDPLFKGFKNYLVVGEDLDDIWIVGHFFDDASGSFDKVLPPTSVSTEFLTVSITHVGGLNFGSNVAARTPKLCVSEGKINLPSSPHPVLATYYKDEPSKRMSPVSSFNGDINGDAFAKMSEIQDLVQRIPLSHTGSGTPGPFHLTTSWLETLDACGKGWLDVADVVTMLLHIRNNGDKSATATPLQSTAQVKTTIFAESLLSTVVCTDKLKVTDCEPCPCPDTQEPIECYSEVWIDYENMQPLPGYKDGNFAIVPVRYKSSCCLDGYVLELGNVKDDYEGWWHGGAIYTPSEGNDIGQEMTETVQRNWLQGSALNPSYSGDVALENLGHLMAWNASTLNQRVIPQYAGFDTQPGGTYTFPVVWGMSLGFVLTSQIENNPKLGDRYRKGFNCIPATCPGETRLLTKFVVNMSSFDGLPTIDKFRLVTNDETKTPASFGPNITWTGDDQFTAGVVDMADWTQAVFLLYSGWSRNSSFTDDQANRRASIAKFDSENDGKFIDVVDALTVSNHILDSGGPAASDNTLSIVPTDCCPCVGPGNFGVKVKRLPCNCWEEGYDPSREGEVVITWTASEGASDYTIYRYIDYDDVNQVPNSSQASDIPSGMNWNQRNFSDSRWRDVLNQHRLRTGLDYQSIFETQTALLTDTYNTLRNLGNGWVGIGRVDGSVTTWVDRKLPDFDCCPGDKLPRVTYIVVAHNECGDVTRKAAFVPECCSDAPVARDVDLGVRTVNTPINFRADAFYPGAAPPYGGPSAAAKASVKFTAVPADGTRIKLIDFKGKVREIVFKAGGGTNTATVFYINITTNNTVQLIAQAFDAAVDTTSDLLITAVASDNGDGTWTVSMIQDDGLANSNAEHTRCGNTKITVSPYAAAGIVATSFTGGNEQCDENHPAFPFNCERLTFEIIDVFYSNVAESEGIFNGPGNGGGALPLPNNNGVWGWIPPAGYVGRVVYTYRVTDENGCFDEGKIKVTYKPVKIPIDCYTPPCGAKDYGNVYLKFNLPDAGAGNVIVLRRPIAEGGDGVTWDTNNDGRPDDRFVLLNAEGNPYRFNLAAWDGPREIKIVDTTATTPDECCTEPVVYEYAIFICYPVLRTIPSPSFTYATAQFVEECEISTVCKVEIECCPVPNNPIPEVCVSDCDGTAAKAKIKVLDSGAILNGQTFTLTDSAGVSTVYTFNGGVAPEAGGGNGGSANVGLSGVGGGVLGKVMAANAIAVAINATTDANYTASTDGVDTVTVTQGTVGSVGNKVSANGDTLGGVKVGSFICGFDATDHAVARVYWEPTTSSNPDFPPKIYWIYRRLRGEAEFQIIKNVFNVRNADNEYWDDNNGHFFFFDKDLAFNNLCAPGVVYEYAVVAESEVGRSGNPNDDKWGTWTTDVNFNQGDACTPGGTTVVVEIVNCPPTPCLETLDIDICTERKYTYDLNKLIGCMPRNAAGEIAGHWVEIGTVAAWVNNANIAYNDGKWTLTFDTYGVDFGTVGAGPHNCAIQWKLHVEETYCRGEYTGCINIRLAECGCPCPDDEKDYTICDVNYDNAEYIDDSLLTTIEQIPFSLHREGVQALRKAQAYMVSRGEIDYV